MFRINLFQMAWTSTAPMQDLNDGNIAGIDVTKLILKASISPVFTLISPLPEHFLRFCSIRLVCKLWRDLADELFYVILDKPRFKRVAGITSFALVYNHNRILVRDRLMDLISEKNKELAFSYLIRKDMTSGDIFE